MELLRKIVRTARENYRDLSIRISNYIIFFTVTRMFSPCRSFSNVSVRGLTACFVAA